jgi:SAM-dependent methyltransferase
MEILIAGCGTSQAARHALRQPEAHVTGIDLSATSIEHTTALKRKYTLTNLALHQPPVERIAELERRFDQVVCSFDDDNRLFTLRCWAHPGAFGNNPQTPSGDFVITIS